MFRLPLGERVDPTEEKRRVRENTIQNVVAFALLVGAIKIAPFVLETLDLM